MDLAVSCVFMGVTRVISLLSAVISQDAVGGAPRSTALMSEFISCCSAPAAPEDPPFCNIPDEVWRNVSQFTTHYSQAWLLFNSKNLSSQLKSGTLIMLHSA